MMTFTELGLNPLILSALDAIGYQQPTPIQAKGIPVLLSGQDMIAQAQTGTGKTAAFALPILHQLQPKQNAPQALIITPTRELAIQVAEAFREYARNLPKVTVTTVYGGADYGVQLRGLKQGSQIVVGTPGRVMDHIERGTLQLHQIKTLVLDEADEMLKMGFLEDVEWILSKMSHTHQMALFSATMPPLIEKIAQNYLQSPSHIQVKSKKETALKIDQTFTRVPHKHKNDALNRFLMVEPVDAAIVFVRTKQDSVQVAEYLQSAGHSVSALNGDMSQPLRQQVIEKIKSKKLNIIVATDVAARGIDMDRISHVFNYDMPRDEASYTHRIGRTGRAGRSGKAFTFVTAREYKAMDQLVRATSQSIVEIPVPSHQAVLDVQRQTTFEKIDGIVKKSKKLASYQRLIADIEDASGLATQDIAAALAYLLDQASGVKLMPDAELDALQRKPKKKQRRHPRAKRFDKFKKKSKKAA